MLCFIYYSIIAAPGDDHSFAILMTSLRAVGKDVLYLRSLKFCDLLRGRDWASSWEDNMKKKKEAKKLLLLQRKHEAVALLQSAFTGWADISSKEANRFLKIPSTNEIYNYHTYWDKDDRERALLRKRESWLKKKRQLSRECKTFEDVYWQDYQKTSAERKDLCALVESRLPPVANDKHPCFVNYDFATREEGNGSGSVGYEPDGTSYSCETRDDFIPSFSRETEWQHTAGADETDVGHEQSKWAVSDERFHLTDEGTFLSSTFQRCE